MLDSQHEALSQAICATKPGCAVASRLGEAGHSVLLLEAGGKDRNPFIHIPLGYSMLYANKSVNWCYESELELHLNNRRLFQPRGKVRGGTGSINGMIYMRGADAFHGSGGPVSVSDIRQKHTLGEAFHSASEALGLPRNDDFNGPQLEGTGYVQTTAKNGRRWSTAAGYLRGTAKKHITLRLNAVV